MRCPKCQTEQSDAAECSACGVIIAKAFDRTRPAQRRHPREQAPEASTTVWVWVVGAVVVVLCALLWGISALRETQGTDATQAAQAAASSQADPADADPALTPPRPARRVGIELDRESVPAVSTPWYEGAEGWAQAQEEQRRNGAPVALYVRVGWCPHCRHFESQVLPDESVKRQLDRVIKVRLDPDRGPEEKQLANELAVTGYPTFRLLTSPDAEPVRLPAGSSVDAAAFTKMVDERLTYIAREWASSVKGQLTDEALSTLDRAVRLAPDNPWTLYARGMHLGRRNAFSQAQDDFRSATRLAPDEPQVHDALGWCLLEQNRFEDALLVFDHLTHLATGPAQARAIYMRGVCQKKLGRTQAAIQDAKTACHLGHATACQVIGQQ